MSEADYLEDGADYIMDEEDFEMCGNDDCEFCEDGFCMKDNYYAECPLEDSEV